LSLSKFDPWTLHSVAIRHANYVKCTAVTTPHLPARCKSPSRQADTQFVNCLSAFHKFYRGDQLNQRYKNGYFSFFCGTTAQLGPRPPHCRGLSLSLTHTHTRQDSCERASSSSQRPLPTQHTTDEHIHVLCRARTRDPSNLAASAYLRVDRPHGHQHHKYDGATEQYSDLCCSRNGQRLSFIY
jgi:hypothetical protein